MHDGTLFWFCFNKQTRLFCQKCYAVQESIRNYSPEFNKNDSKTLLDVCMLHILGPEERSCS